MDKEIVAGIDIGGTNTAYGLVDRQGNILARGTVDTDKSPQADGFVKILAGQVNKLLAEHKELTLKGVGIGAPNGNYHKGTIELAPNLAWKGIVPFGDMMEKEIQKPVVLTNDATAAAVGEMIFGGAREMRDFIILTLGTGLGSGFVVDGQVVYGHTGFAGEYGHVIMIPGGRDCGCGRKGCLETYASATGIVRTVKIFMEESKEDSILRAINPAVIDSRMVAEAAAKGDKLALDAFDYTARILALAIVNAVVVTSPEAIFLFGGLAKAGDLLFKPLEKYIDEFVQPVFRNTFKVLPSAIPETNAAVLGAAALAWKEI
ncbi:MAG: ROK family protein [Bacteroidales bacterium]|jgi:glucokinase|nr:ROK family protein [Bacteroidales bacterium]